MFVKKTLDWGEGLPWLIYERTKCYLPVVALFANWFEVNLVELCLDRHLLVAGGAGEVVHAPGLVQGRENVSLDDLKMTLSSTLWNTKIGAKAATTLLYFCLRCCKHGRGFRIVGGSVSRNKPVLSSRSGGFPGKASRIWRRRSVPRTSVCPGRSQLGPR